MNNSLQNVTELDEYRRNLTKPPKKADLKTTWLVQKYRTAADMARIKLKENQKNIKEGLIDYTSLVKTYFKNWTNTMRNYDHDNFVEACSIIWMIIWDLGHDKEYFAKVFNENIEKLTDIERFLKAFLFFLVDPRNKLNISNLKKYIAILSKKATEDDPEFIFVEEYIDYLLDATRNIIEDQEMKIDYSFLDIKA